MRLWTLRTLALSMLVSCAAARASYIYDFNVHAADGIDAFSFSFTVPDFVADGQSPTFTPFSVTDGTHTWTMVNDLTGFTPGLPTACFAFDTGGTSSLQSQCAVGVFAPPDGALTLALGPGVLFPNATGVYALSGSGLFDFVGAQGTLITSPVGTLTISSTPEPRGASILLGLAFLALAWKLRKRLA